MATCGVNGNVVWGSIQGLTLNGEGGGAVKPIGTWIYSVEW